MSDCKGTTAASSLPWSRSLLTAWPLQVFAIKVTARALAAAKALILSLRCLLRLESSDSGSGCCWVPEGPGVEAAGFALAGTWTTTSCGCRCFPRARASPGSALLASSGPASSTASRRLRWRTHRSRHECHERAGCYSGVLAHTHVQ